ncbi:flagellar biosynthetic protein FliO [Solimicrobium silvestre]|uniref:Flagellar protein n=1 Tax=Solimicrobium silvestre TaxID=2099400 RepID=A0A2S9GSW7_9BURK|nr:flagellar biosynthetic protein FliO [Solimicrobium silvestre]PRC90786.1 Flagellar biosynthetic protein FliO [Solimicrobium silvestre]
MKLLTLFWLVVYCSASHAVDASAGSAAGSTTSLAAGNLIQVTLSLLLVIAILIALSVAFKKFGLNRIQAAFPVKVVGAISVGNHQRIMVIEAGDEWIVLGVTPQHISTITSMPRQKSDDTSNSNGNNKAHFSTWMQSALEKYHVKKT